ncbi:MAG: tRNA (adenosine(37)-N6)-dimethylallyltransferase MiaA [Hyphomicrobiales bacterium]|nr:tRNA (adenosine(37)-N6)-dimethylallyltransferase MiaA [Hyphomicrobiales bacterium]
MKGEGESFPRAVLIAGPTASGKSAVALELARAFGGVVINADSMQIYDGLRLLTARPSAAEEALAPHRLYGHVDPSRSFSVVDWLADVAATLDDLHLQEEIPLPIFVGGTGLYFEALTKGLAPVPEVAEEIRAHWRGRAAEVGAEALHRDLALRDPAMAERLRPTDTQRLTRALEVIEATGRSLADWQAEPHSSPLVAPEDAVRIVLEPERATLHARIARRFHAMVEGGAVDEAASFAARGLSPDLPATRAIGVAALADAAAGRISLEEAIERGIVETRQYAKRQSTWLRGRMGEWAREATVEAAIATAAATIRRGWRAS